MAQQGVDDSGHLAPRLARDCPCTWANVGGDYIHEVGEKFEGHEDAFILSFCQGQPLREITGILNIGASIAYASFTRLKRNAMTTTLKIDFVSDISCPWCAIGLHALEQALDDVAGEISAELRFQPFELNPQMPAEGQAIDEHIAQKYGSTPEQMAQNRETIRRRGEEVGFIFGEGKRSRIYNTFDAHRLLHWAEQQGRQRELEHALFEAYFTRGENPGDHGVLLNAAQAVGLDRSGAAAILASDEYAQQVRERERFYLDAGIHSVPSVIINDRHLIQGGQPAQVFAQALRQIAAGA
jgi:predicted DsbA family dithiol-disulfide isomerase